MRDRATPPNDRDTRKDRGRPGTARRKICDRPLSRDKPPLDTATLPIRGNCKLKCHSRADIGGRPHPPSVSFDDRTTDGESHTHTIWLRRVKRAEKAVQPLGLRADADVLYGHEHLVGFALFGSDG